MTTKVAKWGNSLALRIPHDIAKRYHFYDGVSIVFTETTKGALIAPVKTTNKSRLPTLKEALINFSPEMIERVSWGRDVGKEKLR